MLFYVKGWRKMNFVDLEIPFDEAENYLKPGNKEKLNKLFYKDFNFEKLLLDTTYYLIGEKGSGKTAYSVYFCNNSFNNTRSSRYVITVDDYCKIIQMKKDGKLNYTHYVTLWKAIILLKLFATINENEISAWGSKAFSSIKGLLKTYNFTEITADGFSPVSLMDNVSFSNELSQEAGLAGVAKIGGGTKANSESQTSVQKHIYFDGWVKFINAISKDLVNLRLKNHHYLFIDGIDSRPSDIPYAEYKECVYPLVRAIYEINNDILSRIKERKRGRLQVILLTRLDIFIKSGLSNPGSKISDNSAFLNWSVFNETSYRNSNLFNLAQNMLFSSATNSNPSWDDYFNFTLSKGTQTWPSFVYFARITTCKPRDFVRIFKIAQEQCRNSQIANPTQKLLTSDIFNRAYSTYFVDSVRTGLSFYYNENEIKVLFSFLKQFRKLSFSYSDIASFLKKHPQKNLLISTFGEIDDILNLLYEHNIICVVEKNKYIRWKHRETTIANYDYSLSSEFLTNQVNFTFHPALEKEFGLYLK